MDKPTIEVLNERIEQWMRTTVEYRKSLCDKISDVQAKVDAICERVNNLPCDTHALILGELQKFRDGRRNLWVGIAIALIGVAMTLAQSLIAYGRLTERVDQMQHERMNVRATQQ